MKGRTAQFVLLTFSLFVFISCRKNGTTETVNESLPGGTKLTMGSFVSNVHPTSGMVRVTEDNGRRYLVFENFRTDNGPDLRVWLAPGTNPVTYQEVGRLRAVSGSFSYELTPSINTTVNNHVLIWCEDFSVLFGHATLN